MAQLECPKCGAKVAVPVHCGKEMHQEGDELVCWMGAACGHQAMPEHCGTAMEYKA
ncbi:MAG: hypothetical protein ACFFD6_01500 [Candidatus Thorarchaeota archaeon]